MAKKVMRKFMTSGNGQKIITINILPNTQEDKQTMKLG